jgi:hypothetical protein
MKLVKLTRTEFELPMEYVVDADQVIYAKAEPSQGASPIVWIWLEGSVVNDLKSAIQVDGTLDDIMRALTRKG